MSDLPGAWPPAAARDRGLRALVDGFPPTTLAAVMDVAAETRTDTKYLMGIADVHALLDGLHGAYAVLEVAGYRFGPYRTLYLDTEDLAMYRAHHARRPFRAKLRSREYVASGQAFLEVKTRGKRGQTTKLRSPVPALVTEVSDEQRSLLGRHAPDRSLVPVLLNEFTRVTMVDREGMERLTVDLDLAFTDGRSSASLPGVAVVELKQDRVDRASAAVRQLRAMRLRGGRFSKYCVGVALLKEGVKHNSFKPQLLRIRRIMRSSEYGR